MRLTESLAEVGHVAELSRLLVTFRGHRKKAIGKRELVELTNHTAGAGHRYPNPLPALVLADALGLAHRRKNVVRLTEIGDQFVEAGSQDPLVLTPTQSKLVFGLLLDDDDSRECFSSVFRSLREIRDGLLGTRQASLPNDEAILTCAKVLQQLGVLKYQEGYLYLNKEFELLLPPQLLRIAGMDEETLWDKLDNQRERAKAVEEFVLAKERDRLTEFGRADLAELVFRTSAVNVSAGFDIESFEVDGSRRYIEVKSSGGTRVRFEWSVAERRKAQELRGRYWIYFVPMAYLLPRIDQILLIRDPVAHVESGSLAETPISFLVQESRTAWSYPKGPVAKGVLRLVEWKLHLVRTTRN